MKNNLRVSYSVLSKIAMGNPQDAIDAYLKRVEPTQMMIDGSLAHKRWEEEINTTGRIPLDFDRLNLDKLRTETKLESNYTKLGDYNIILSGIIDVIAYERGLLIDFKYSTSSPTVWLDTYQLGVYKVLVDKETDYIITMGSIFCFDYQKQKPSSSYVFFTNQYIIDTKKWILDNTKKFIEAIESTDASTKELIKLKIKNDSL